MAAGLPSGKESIQGRKQGNKSLDGKLCVVGVDEEDGEEEGEGHEDDDTVGDNVVRPGSSRRRRRASEGVVCRYEGRAMNGAGTGSQRGGGRSRSEEDSPGSCLDEGEGRKPAGEDRSTKDGSAGEGEWQPAAGVGWPGSVEDEESYWHWRRRGHYWQK